MRKIAAVIITSSSVLVIITGLAIWKGGGEYEGNDNSTARNAIETQTETEFFLTTTGEGNDITNTEAVTVPLVNTAMTSTAKVTRTPCRTKTGVLCKSWVYFGQTISG